jgi:uncharacterized protein (TIGR02270 family)
MNAIIIPHIIEQHVEEAGFLWFLRDLAVQAPHYKLRDLDKLDNRVEAHIDGLRVAGEEGWQLSLQALEENTPGGLFVIALLALESNNQERLNQVIALAESNPEIRCELFSAFGWASPNMLRGKVKELLVSDSAFRKWIGIRACAFHRVNPGSVLESAMVSDNPLLQAAAFRTAGELGRTDLLAFLLSLFPIKDQLCQFWAAWAAVLLGNRGKALDVLNESTLLPSPLQIKALQVVLRVLNDENAKNLLKNLIQQPECLRQTVRGAGITGDPYFIPWLIRQMETLSTSRLAGESFSLITGADIEKDSLEGKIPEDIISGPTDDAEDDNVAMDEDENLPWPDYNLVQNWWGANKFRFASGHRYLMGQQVNISHCHNILATGFQRQRIAAAFEISLQQPGTPLFDWHAPGWRQQKIMKEFQGI